MVYFRNLKLSKKSGESKYPSGNLNRGADLFGIMNRFPALHPGTHVRAEVLVGKDKYTNWKGTVCESG